MGVWGCGDKSVSYVLCGHRRDGGVSVFVLWVLGKSVMCLSCQCLSCDSVGVLRSGDNTKF